MGVARTTGALIVLLLVAGCTSVTPVQSPAASDSGSPTPAWPSDTSYGRLFSQVQPDGSVSMDVALEAFSTAIAPLPGVPVAPGGPPTDFERADGTFAVQWILPYEDQITPEQKAAVDAALAPDPNAPVHTPSTAGTAVSIELADENPSQYFSDLASAAIPTIEGKLGWKLDTPWTVTLNETEQLVNGKAALAWNGPRINLASGLIGCDIHVNPSLANSGDEAAIRTSMAHEIFHCFQFEYLDEHGGYRELPDWIMEGQAEWAGESAGVSSSVGAGWWARYLASPGKPLWQRDYDAVGFYQHLAEEGIDPWTHFDAMFAAFLGASQDQANSDTFKAAGAVADNFLDTWASGMSRTASLPSAWNAHGLWATTEHAPLPIQRIFNGDLANVAAPPVTNADWGVEAHADITELSFEGHVRMYTDNVDTPEITTVDLCTKNTASGCTCPDGSYFDGPPLQNSDGIIYLGITGSLDGSTGTIRGRPLSDFCKPGASNQPFEPGAPRGGADPCANGCAGSIGDPHLETIDQQEYDFQAAGEFTLLRSPDGTMEMQGRQVPYTGAEKNVSINTALAWKVAGHRVGMYANEGSDTYSLWLDGTQVDPTSIGTMDLGGGAALTAMAGGLEVAYGDGTIATVFFHGNGFADALDLQVAPSDTFRSQAVGLLAQIAAGSQLPALQDGTALPLSQDQTTRFTQRYKQLGPSWLVTDQTSLFDYQPGDTTATFYKPDYPSADSPMDLDLDGLKLLQGDDAFQGAADNCATVQDDTNPYLDCVFDILQTGDPDFAQVYALLQQFFAQGPTALQTRVVEGTPPPPPTNPTGSLPGGLVQVASGIALIDGATVGPDGTVYASLSTTNDYSPELVSVSSTGQPGPSVTPSGAGAVFLLDGSLWVAEDDPTGSGNCLLERFDPATLASQAKIPIGCDIGGPQAVPVTDGVWWLDRSTEDANGNGGTLRHVDPATTTVDRSVPLPYVNGRLGSSPSTVVYGDASYGYGLYLLSEGASALTPLNLPDKAFTIVPAGHGVWYQPEGSINQLPEADFATQSGGPDKVIPIDGTLTIADENAIYVDSPGNNPDTLTRIPIDGSPSSTILSGPTITTATGSDDLGFFNDSPLVIANGKIAKLWLVSDWPTADTTSLVAEVVSVP